VGVTVRPLGTKRSIHRRKEREGNGKEGPLREGTLHHIEKKTTGKVHEEPSENNSLVLEKDSERGGEDSLGKTSLILEKSGAEMGKRKQDPPEGGGEKLEETNEGKGNA